MNCISSHFNVLMSLHLLISLKIKEPHSENILGFRIAKLITVYAKDKIKNKINPSENSLDQSFTQNTTENVEQ